MHAQQLGQDVLSSEKRTDVASLPEPRGRGGFRVPLDGHGLMPWIHTQLVPADGGQRFRAGQAGVRQEFEHHAPGSTGNATIGHAGNATPVHIAGPDPAAIPEIGDGAGLDGDVGPDALGQILELEGMVPVDGHGSPAHS